MKSSEIIKKIFVYEKMESLFKSYDADKDLNNNFLLFKEISTKSIELQKIGIVLYYLENSKKNIDEIYFETVNIKWWTNHIKFFEDIYYYLTNNTIEIKLKEVKGPILNYKERKSNYNDLVLFSGGLDSLIGILYLSQKGENFVLSHTKTSKNMFGKAKALYNLSKTLKQFPLININAQFKAHSIKPESPQTRTLLFILNSIPICEFYGINNIKIFENVALMVNPPISPYAIPTKTTRPELIIAFNKFFKDFLDFKLKIELPFRFYTKAEIIAAFKSSQEIMTKSYSCFNYRGKTKMCGKCYGCFIRMISLSANSIIEPYNYISNILKYKKYPNKQSDYDKFLIIEDLIDFCKNILLKKKLGGHIEESINSANIFDDFDIWDPFFRFSEDVFLGIYKYYKLKNLNPNNYLIGKNIIKQIEILSLEFLEKKEDYLLKFKIDD